MPNDGQFDASEISRDECAPFMICTAGNSTDARPPYRMPEQNEMLRLANCIAMLLCISCGDDRRDPAAARQHFDLTVKLPLNAIAKSKFRAGVHLAGRGYGSAVLGGIQAARGKYVIMGDSVDSYEFSRLDVFVEWLRAGFRPVMG